MKESTPQRHLRWLLLFLVVLLTFEGLARKLQIANSSIAIFLFKDFVVLVMALYVLRMPRHPALDFLWGAYLTTGVLFIPVIMWTAVHDPILAIFGTKEYLLYPIVAFAVFFAFHNQPVDQIYRFFRPLALLIIPTTLIAVWEHHLPSTHWLNRSVEGENLAAFSAGGELRICSTFSFIAQYCAFLNAEIFMTMVALNHLRGVNFLLRIAYGSLFPLLVVGCYITGSRGAVVGNTVLIVLAGLLASAKFQFRVLFRVLVLVGGILITIGLAQYFFPDLFAAYSSRENGHLVGVSSEIQTRVFGALFNWTEQVFSVPFFGHGIGIMSNGSDYFSDYAGTFRSTGIWTETDLATTLFEGGLYLIFVWYGFRYYVIFEVVKRFFLDVRGEITISSAFCTAFVIVVGLTATLAIQPPMAIWWWLSVGAALSLWWKCASPDSVLPEEPSQPAAPVEKKIRGRSAYAERLHGR
jgi:hypothetical protein